MFSYILSVSTFLICSSLSYFFSFWFWFCFCFSFCFWFLFCFWFHLSAGLRHFYQIFTRMRRVTLPHNYVISAHCDASAPVIIFSWTMNTNLFMKNKQNIFCKWNLIFFFNPCYRKIEDLWKHGILWISFEINLIWQIILNFW